MQHTLTRMYHVECANTVAHLTHMHTRIYTYACILTTDRDEYSDENVRVYAYIYICIYTFISVIILVTVRCRSHHWRSLCCIRACVHEFTINMYMRMCARIYMRCSGDDYFNASMRVYAEFVGHVYTCVHHARVCATHCRIDNRQES